MYPYAYALLNTITECPIVPKEYPHNAPTYYAVDFSQCPLHIICARFDYHPENGLYSLTHETPLTPRPNTTPIHMFLQKPCSTNLANVVVESQGKIFTNPYHCQTIIDSGVGAQWGPVTTPIPVLRPTSRFNPEMANNFWASIHRSQRNLDDLLPVEKPSLPLNPSSVAESYKTIIQSYGQQINDFKQKIIAEYREKQIATAASSAATPPTSPSAAPPASSVTPPRLNIVRPPSKP